MSRSGTWYIDSLNAEAAKLTPEHYVTMEQAARRFQGAFTGTSGTLAGYVLLLLRERERLLALLSEREERQP